MSDNYEYYENAQRIENLLEEKLEDMQTIFDAIYDKISTISGCFEQIAEACKKELENEGKEKATKKFGADLENINPKSINNLISKIFGN